MLAVKIEFNNIIKMMHNFWFICLQTACLLLLLLDQTDFFNKVGNEERIQLREETNGQMLILFIIAIIIIIMEF